MNIPTVKELVVDKKVFFVRFQDGNLWYRGENGFEFPVPITDAESGAFLAEDKAVHFMRWIRKHIEMLNQAVGEVGDK